MNKKVHKYLLEPILSSELILVNNAKKLKENPELLNEKYLDDIENLREEYYNLELRSQSGEKKLQKYKRECRQKLIDYSVATFTNRNSDLFGKMVIRMIDGVLSRPQFNNYTFKDEMRSLATQHILLYTWKFDPYKTSQITNQRINAFAYLSTIIFNACVATINKFNKDQLKAKEDFLEHQKLTHRDPNQSTIGPDFEDAKRKISLPSLKTEENELLKIMKTTTINEATEFWIPEKYRISQKELQFIEKYIHNISIRRLKG